MAVFRKFVCTGAKCYYWRAQRIPRDQKAKGDGPKASTPPCPACGSPVRQTENYTIQWYDANGKKRTETVGSDCRDAKQQLAERLAGRKGTPSIDRPQERGTAGRPSGAIAFDVLALEFQRIHAAEIKDTVREEIAIRHLIGFFGSRPLRAILQKDVREYRGHRQGQTVLEGKVELKKNGEPFDRKKPARNVCAATVGRELAVLKLILNYADTNNYIRYEREKDHPFYDVEIPVSREVKPRWTLQDLDRLFALLTPELSLFFRFLAETGCRMEEAMALTWFRVVPDKKIAYLRDTKTAEAEGEEEVLHLSPAALALMESQPRGCEGDYVFYNPKTKTRWKNPRSPFKRAAIKAGFLYEDGKVIRPHDLRHIFLTALANSGTNDAVLMEISRHADIRSIRRYTEVRNASAQEALLTMKRA